MAVPGKTGCKTLGKSSGTIYVGRESVTANHNGQWL
jgi:hypothetical protein